MHISTENSEKFYGSGLWLIFFFQCFPRELDVQFLMSHRTSTLWCPLENTLLQGSSDSVVCLFHRGRALTGPREMGPRAFPVKQLSPLLRSNHHCFFLLPLICPLQTPSSASVQETLKFAPSA